MILRMTMAVVTAMTVGNYRVPSTVLYCCWSLSHVRLFVTPWTASRQASLSFTITWSLLKLMSIELMMPSNHFILFCPLLLLPSIFSSIRVFSNESALTSSGLGIGVSASTSALPMNIQGWFPLGLTDLISWQNSVSLCLASFCIPRPNLPITPGISWLPNFVFQSPMMKIYIFLLLVLESLLGLHRTDNLQLLWHQW